MRLNRLKTLRIGISVLFFALIAFLFLDFWNLGAQFIAGGLLYLQFVPSLLKFVNTAAFGAAGFIVVLIITALFGRVYCSTICPLGTLQDVIGFVFRRNRKPDRYRYKAPQNLLRYAVLVLTVAFLIAGSGFLLNLLDPFSTFGRIASNLLRPAALAVNNAAAMTLEMLDVHALYRVQWTVIAPISVGFSIGLLMLVGLLSARHGRLYCNTCCPVGALLGLLAKYSLFQIGMDSSACKGCRLCESVCKAGCIDIQNKIVDATRCVGCYNCFAVCRKKGLRFESRWPRILSGSHPEPERRGFILNSVIWFVGIMGFAEPARKIIQSKPTTIPVQLTNPVTPPGSRSLEHFTSTCTACHLCVSICPSRVLVPSFLEYGFLGIMQPRMNYHAGHCNYECNACMDVCPSGAILPLDLGKKKLTQLGVAKFIKENCVVFTDKTNCGACSEHCPTKAVNMVPYANPANKQLVIPEVKAEYCIGCGACEHACPTKPYKAIYVNGNPVHKIAQMPVVKTIDQKIDYDADFPF
jgi:ferredoxin/cytochrome b subunit of formate dehydrogenase